MVATNVYSHLIPSNMLLDAKLSGPPDRDIVWAPPVRVVIVCGGGAYDDDACDACRRGCDPSVAVELLLRGCDPSVAVELHSDCTTAGAIRQL